jgi:hypothetical protein
LVDVMVCALDAVATSKPMAITSSAIANTAARPPRFRPSQPPPLAAKSMGLDRRSVETRCDGVVKAHLRRRPSKILNCHKYRQNRWLVREMRAAARSC